jgi:hypothetical protein
VVDAEHADDARHTLAGAGIGRAAHVTWTHP